MPLLLIVLIFAAVFCLTLAIFKKSPSHVDSRLDNLRGLSVAQQIDAMEKDEKLQESFRNRLLRPAYSASKGSASRLLPTSWTRGIEAKMEKARVSVPVGGFITVWMAMTFGFPLLFLMVVVGSGAPMGPMQFVAVGAMGGLGAILPRTWLNGKIRTRQTLMEKELADAIDLVTTCVEAGLGLDMALQRVTTKTTGPLSEELAIVLHEVSMGRPRREALLDLSARVQIKDLTSFINSVVQAEQLGVSLGQVLRVQAQHLRTKRRQRAEEQAFKAPIKMIFPLVGFIFPALFLVVLGPAGIALFNAMGKSGGG